MRLAAGLIALAYAVLVVAMGAAQLASGATLLAYPATAVVAPIAVIAGDRLSRDGSQRADILAQLGLGVVTGIWALPASSGLVAILAVIAGVSSAFRSERRRWSAVLAFVIGAGGGAS